MSANPLSAAALQAARSGNVPSASAYQFSDTSPDPFPSITVIKPASDVKTKVQVSQQENISSESAFPSLSAAIKQPNVGMWAMGSSKLRAGVASPQPRSGATTPGSENSGTNGLNKSSSYTDSMSIGSSAVEHTLTHGSGGRPSDAQGQPVPRVDKPKTLGEALKHVMNIFKGLTIESSTSRRNGEGTITFLFKGPSMEIIGKGKLALTALISRRVTIHFEVPEFTRATIIGPKGVTLKHVTESTGTRINMPPKSAQNLLNDDENENVISISIEGEESATAIAKKQILQLIKAQISQGSTKIENISPVHFPMVRLFAIDIANHYNVEIIVPPAPVSHHILQEADTTCDAQSSNSITLRGDKEVVFEAAQQVQKVYQSRMTDFQNIKIPVTSAQQRLLEGPFADELYRQTGCFVEIFSASPTGSVNIIGPMTSAGPAMTLITNQTLSLPTQSINLASNGAAYGRILLRYLLTKNRLKNFAKSHSQVKIFAPKENFTSNTNLISIDIIGEVSSVTQASHALTDLLSSINPACVASISVDHLLHKVLSGNRAKSFEDSNKVQLSVPSFESQSQEIMIFAQSPELLANGRMQLEKLVDRIGQVVSEKFRIDSKFTSAITGPNNSNLNAMIGEEQLTEILFGKLGDSSLTPGEVLVRGPKDEVIRVCNLIKQAEIEAKEDEILSSFAITFEIASSNVGQLVGKAGANIAKFRESLNVQVDFEDEKTSKKTKATTTVKIMGKQMNAEEAKKRMLAQIDRLEDETTEVMRIHPQYHAALIGTGGKWVIRLQDKHDVNITFPKDHNNGTEKREQQKPDEVIIRGGKKGVAQAKSEITEALEFEKENNQTTTFTVPSSSVARIVGKGGAHISEIKQSTGTQIDIEPANKASSSTSVTVKGSKAAIASAKSAILAVSILADSEETQKINIDQKYHRSLIGSGGSRLKEIISSCGGPSDTAAQNGLIRFPRQGERSDVVTVNGEKNLVSKICAELHRIVEDLTDRVLTGVSLPTDIHRTIIGRGASNLSGFQKKFDVTLSFPGWSEYDSIGQCDNHVELSESDSATIVKVQGSLKNVKAAIAELKKKVQPGSAAGPSLDVNVPEDLQLIIANGGSLFRQLRSKGVNVTHAKLPEADNNLPKPQFSEARLDSQSAQEDFQWNMQPLTRPLDAKSKTWTLKAKDQSSLDHAKTVLESAISAAESCTHIGFMAVNDRSIFPRIIGQKGAGIARLHNESQAEILVGKTDNLITIRGSEQAVLKAKDLILKLNHQGRQLVRKCKRLRHVARHMTSTTLSRTARRISDPINKAALEQFVHSKYALYADILRDLDSGMTVSSEMISYMGRLKQIQSSWSEYADIKRAISETITAAAELNTEEIAFVAQCEVVELTDKLEGVEKKLYQSVLDINPNLSQNYGSDGIQIRLQIGFGNDDASELLGHLLSMYRKRSGISNWKFDLLSTELYRGNPNVGFKSASFNVMGKSAWKYLQHENGLHRFSRASPRDAGRLQTSSVQVITLPLPLSEEFDDKTCASSPTERLLKFKADEFKIDSFCASGPGGQHVNKAASAVRITHIPTGCVVSMQDSRSQHQNLKDAKELILQRIESGQMGAQREARKATLRSLQKDDRQDRWSQKIRSYIYHDSRVVDARLKDSKGRSIEWNCEEVLNGTGLVELGELLDLADLRSKVRDIVGNN